jgi:hypothetical protein
MGGATPLFVGSASIMALTSRARGAAAARPGTRAQIFRLLAAGGSEPRLSAAGAKLAPMRVRPAWARESPTRGPGKEKNMPVSGLVLTLESPENQAPVLARLGADSRITIGPQRGPHLPVVTETRSSQEGEALVEELFHIPGVCFVDVVTIDFSDEEG